MFELCAEATGPSLCHAPAYTERRKQHWSEAGPGGSITLEDADSSLLRWGPAVEASPKVRQSRVRFETWGECKSTGQCSKAPARRRDSRGHSHLAGLDLRRGTEGHCSSQSNSQSRRLHTQPFAAVSFSQAINHLPGYHPTTPPSSPHPMPADEKKARPDGRTAGLANQGRGLALLQHLAKVSIPWLRYTRFSVAQSRAIMRNIPLLERAGLGALAGGLAGGFTNATLHPIDTVKTKLQAKGGTGVYTGAWDVVRKVLANQGIGGFYRGLPAAVVGSIPSSAVYFGTYELGKELLLRLPSFNTNRLAVPPFAAALGNIASSAILVPKELVKQRLQAGAAGTARGVLAGILREEGVKGLYRGYSAALLRNVPSNVISFSTFEYLKAAWLAGSGEAELKPWQSLLSGAVAGMLSAAATTPLDVVKTRLMTEARQAVSRTGATGKLAEVVAKAQFVSAFTPSGVVSTLRQISAEEGFKGLVRGAGPRIVYGGCFSAMGFLSFETAKHILLERYLRKKEGEELGRGRVLGAGGVARASKESDVGVTVASMRGQEVSSEDRPGANGVLQSGSRKGAPLLLDPDRSRGRYE